MPEQLTARGISWMVYGSLTGDFGDNDLPYFEPLPQVSWVLAPLAPVRASPAPVAWGEHASATVPQALTGNQGLWARTALFITFDENGGFFDHVPTPVAPAATPGE